MSSVNLIPASLRMERMKRNRRRMWVIIASVGWVLAGIPTGQELWAQYQLNAQRIALETASQTLENTRKEKEATTQKLTALRQEIARAEKLRYKRHWTDLLNTISGAMPEGVWLTSVATDPAEPEVQSSVMSPVSSPKSASEDSKAAAVQTNFSYLIGRSGPRRLLVEGHALGIEDIYVFVGAVNKLGIFKNAGLKSVKEGEVEGIQINVFVLECEW